jgi:predicted AAA+ superfamily ATPase
MGGHKAIVLMGARQVGKTTLLRRMLPDDGTPLWLNADEARVRALFDDVTADGFTPYLAGRTTLVIDEAQRIEDIGVKLKILQDAFGEEIQIVATGSSSFELANRINEPQPGRRWEYRLFPLSAAEMVAHHGLLTEEALMETRLQYGWYPDVVSHPQDAETILTGLAADNLYKDIFQLRGVRKPAAFERLVQALAYQVGSQVSMTELGALAGLDNKTADAYVRLLEQAYIVFRLGSFSTNLRNELKASSKVFFYDVGLRNAVIGDFRPPANRTDIGGLFENFVIAELVKAREGAVGWFWRTTAGQEVDYVIRRAQELVAYEMKWSPTARLRLPAAFIKAYQPVETTLVTRANAIRVLSAPRS